MKNKISKYSKLNSVEREAKIVEISEKLSQLFGVEVRIGKISKNLNVEKSFESNVTKGKIILNVAIIHNYSEMSDDEKTKIIWDNYVKLCGEGYDKLFNFLEFHKKLKNINEKTFLELKFELDFLHRSAVSDRKNPF